MNQRNQMSTPPPSWVYPVTTDVSPRQVVLQPQDSLISSQGDVTVEMGNEQQQENEHALSRAESLDDPARILWITGELEAGFASLAQVPPVVSIFGSARTSSGTPDYEAAVTTARLLAQAGFGIITGGGPGIMEAANKGGREGGGYSIGCTIQLERVEPPNPFVTVSVPFRYFFVRKTMFVKYSHAFICFPGGFGTADELFDALNLIQQRKISLFPVILFRSSYWGGLMDWMREAMLKEGKISPGDVDVVRVSDDPAEVCGIVCQHYAQTRQNPAASVHDQSIR
ncbi:MAG: hypothetical protein NVSMB49_23690 [Ktedonobacteraceae bacterium]